jgi:hypothetical protein
MAMNDLDPSKPQYGLNPLNRPASPILDFLLRALSMPNTPAGNVGFVRDSLEAKKAHAEEAASGLGFDQGDQFDPNQQVTEQRGVIGHVLQSLGVLGEPSPRPMTDYERAAARYGADLQKQRKMKEAEQKSRAQHRENQDVLGGMREDREARQGALGSAARMGSTFGPKTAQDVLRALGYDPSGIEFPQGMGSVQRGERADARGEEALRLREQEFDFRKRTSATHTLIEGEKLKLMRFNAQIRKRQAEGKDSKDLEAKRLKALANMSSSVEKEIKDWTSPSMKSVLGDESQAQAIKDRLTILRQMRLEIRQAQAAMGGITYQEPTVAPGDTEDQHINDLLEPSPRR